MSTPPAPPPQQTPYYGSNMPPIPIPNPEFLVYVVALLVLGLVAATAETVVLRDFFTAATWLTIGYIISRGIAKLGRVYENR